MKDVIIIGAGIIGCSTARELSRYKADILVLDKANDVSCGTTKANSGIVHQGFDAKVGSVKAEFNVKGCMMYEKLSKELDFPYKKNGAFVLSFDDDKTGLLALYDRGIKNGCPNMEIISGDKVREIEPNVSKEVKWALYAKDSGIVSPYEMCIAYAENAASNGVKFNLDEEVLEVKKIDDHFVVKTVKDTYEAKVVINAAGLYSDKFNNMVSSTKYEITARKGEYMLLDKEFSYVTKTTLFQLPTKMGKGILVAPTCHNNILVGPTAIDQESKDNTDTTYEGLKDAWEKGMLSVPSIPRGGIITQFSGLRAHTEHDDFIIGFCPDCKGFYNLLGIESPGLASSPAISEYASKEVSSYLNLEENKEFNPVRIGIKHISHMSNQELEEAIKENPLYGHVICRCEVVSEAEIIEAIRRVPGAKDLDGIKRRTRAGMGRCQMGFCTPKIMELLSKELNVPMEEITKKGNDSNLLIGRIKE